MLYLRLLHLTPPPVPPVGTDLVNAVVSSKHPLINVLFPQDQKMSAKDKRSSLSKQFQHQLSDLM